MQQGQKQKTIRRLSIGRSKEAGSSKQDEDFGEIPKESTYARVWKNKIRHKGARRGLWWNPKGKHLRQSRKCAYKRSKGMRMVTIEQEKVVNDDLLANNN